MNFLPNLQIQESTKVKLIQTSVYAKRSGQVPISLNMFLHRQGYKLVNKIASGAFSKVQLVYSHSYNKNVVMKIMDKSTLEAIVWNKFIPREIDAICRLDHPHIIRTYEVILTDTHIFIIMEHAEGGSLQTHLHKKKQLTEYSAKRMFLEFVSAIKYIHGKQIFHRDLKPENILLDKNSRIKLADFGFCKRTNVLHSRLETYCGSLLFASPEVINNNPYVGSFSDIWSLGIILYLMLVGHLPFTENELWLLDQESLVNFLKFPDSHEISFSCIDLIKRILVYRPIERISLCEIEKHTWLLKHMNKMSVRTPLKSDLRINNKMYNRIYTAGAKLPPLT